MPITRPLDASEPNESNQLNQPNQSNERLPLPRYIQIEPSGQCNLRCRMCSIRHRQDAPPDGSPAFMQLGRFRELIDRFPGAERLHLQGLGEPLMHPDFFKMVSYAAERGLFVTTNSNVTLLDPGRAEECVRSGVSWIRVSIDGAQPETYQSIRTGSSLDRVLANIGLLQAAKQRLYSETPRLFFVTVVMKRNISELKDIVRLAYRLSIKELFVQHLCHDFSEDALIKEYEPMRQFVQEETLQNEDPRFVGRHFAEARRIARELSVELRLPAIAEREQRVRKKGRERCDWPWSGIYISYEGRVMPCCVAATPDRVNFGSVARQRIDQIWNNEAYREFRARLDSDDPPPLCRACAVYQGTF